MLWDCFINNLVLVKAAVAPVVATAYILSHPTTWKDGRMSILISTGEAGGGGRGGGGGEEPMRIRQTSPVVTGKYEKRRR